MIVAAQRGMSAVDRAVYDAPKGGRPERCGPGQVRAVKGQLNPPEGILPH